MKTINRIQYILGLVLPIILLASCKKDFLERPPIDSISDANFYKTDEQVMASTGALYSKVWFDYNDKAYYNLGDFRAGTAYSAWNDRGNVLFNTTGDNGENAASWRAFFNVVGQSNLAIVNINRYAGAEVTERTKKTAIAEARFMRALAYRYLVMNWGEVPIIENNIEKLSDTSLRKNTIPSVWRFITREMRAAEADLPEVASQPGRVTKWSAEGMLARFYLTRAGVESTGGVRKQQFLDSAKYYAQRVITQSGRKLLPNYADLFHYPYDNNSESLFELQWVFLPGAWGVQNSMPAYLNYSSDIANGDGWGGDKGATWWMIQQYDGFQEQPGGATMKGRTLDQRLKATFMLPGAHYSEIHMSPTQELVFPQTGTDQNFLSIKKYVVGRSKEDLGGQAASQNYPNNTYMMRLAEMYLIYAEAALRDNASTTDAQALAYFNAIRKRAGLEPLADANGVPLPITWNDIFRERIKEFAMESMAWYDFVSLHYYNPQKAYDLINSQDRGYYFTKADKIPDPTEWTFTKTAWATTDRTVHAHEGNFRLPIPNAELTQAPNLQKPAVDYP